MSELNVNSDLLKCENDFFIKENQTKSLLITKNAKKSSIVSKNEIKTEKIDSSVLNRAKDFLDKSKTDVNIGENCDLVDDSTEQTDKTDGKPLIEMDLMLFKDNLSDNESSEDESDSESDESSADNSEREGSDSDDESDHKNKRSTQKMD